MSYANMGLLDDFDRLSKFKVLSGFKKAIDEIPKFSHYCGKSKMINTIKFSDLKECEKNELIKIINDCNNYRFVNFYKEYERTIDINDSERLYFIIFNNLT